MVLKIGKHRFNRFQIFVHLGSMLPLVWIILTYLLDEYKINPIQTITHQTGRYALIWYLLSLTCTPLVTLLGFNPALKVRRALGLYAFFYASLHFLTFAVLDYRLDMAQIVTLIITKRYLIVGATALIILIALAVTSTKASMKKLGKTWQKLHKLAYPGSALVVLHYIWAVKADIRTPLLYGSVLAVLLVLRLPVIRKWASNKPSWLRNFNHHLVTLAGEK